MEALTKQTMDDTEVTEDTDLNVLNRIRLSVTLPGEDKGLKTFIQQFMAQQRIGGVVERIKEENGYSTTVLMEANESSIQTGRLLLVDVLQKKFPNLQIPPNEEWRLEHSKSRLLSSKVKRTSNPAVSRENSSGKVTKEDLFDEVDPNESASHIGSRALSLLEHVAHLFKKTQRTVITVSYKSNHEKKSETFDITTCTSWANFLEKVDKSPELAIPIHTRKIYHYLPQGGHSYVSDLSALQEGKEYFVETDLDKPGNSSTKFSPEMEEFFEKLRADRKRPESDIVKIREIFNEQGILFEDLMETGDLAITDGKLERVGIVQLGLRTAILAVIKSGY